MRAIVPVDRFAVNEPNKGLVDEGRRLEAVSDALSSHATPSDAVEFLVDERNQAVERTLVALAPFK